MSYLKWSLKYQVQFVHLLKVSVQGRYQQAGKSVDCVMLVLIQQRFLQTGFEKLAKNLITVSNMLVFLLRSPMRTVNKMLDFKSWMT
jgi:hypothetical protein